MLPDGGFLLVGHLAIYGQVVNLQMIEPLRQFDFVGKVEGQPLDVRQLGKVFGHFVHAQLDAVEGIL